jgi:hypothetical protein
VRGLTTRSRSETRSRSLWAAGVALALVAVLTACSGDDSDVDPALTSTVGQPFEIVEHDGAEYVVGHGVVLELAPGWTDYEDERESADGSTHEWAVGLPVEEGTFPSGLQLSMGKPGVGAQIDTLPEAHRELAELSEGYEFVDEGEADVPGAERAAFVRFVRDFEYEGEELRLEQLTLMIEVAEDTTSTIRFLAPEGDWEEQMGGVYESVRVTAEEDAGVA